MLKAISPFVPMLLTAICLYSAKRRHCVTTYISNVVCNFSEFGTVSKWCIREWVNADGFKNLSSAREWSVHVMFISSVCIINFSWRNHTNQIYNYTLLLSLLPQMPILGSSNSAANQNMTSKNMDILDTIIWFSRKHCWKRRNCSLRASSFFPTMFSKDVFC